MRRGWISALASLAALVGLSPAWAQSVVDPENLVVFDTRFGDIVVELRPEFAPNHAERIKTLARQGFYDGLTFHRVIGDFMAQGGDPTGTGGGGSPLPDLEAEFTARVSLGSEAVKIGEIRNGQLTIGENVFSSINGAPVARRFPRGGGDVSIWNTVVVFHEPAGLAMLTGDGRVTANIQHCAGVTSMARATPPNSANSQFFLMRGAAPWLDRQYTAWGRVVDGLDAVMALAIGEPPASPDVMRSVRVAADLPQADRPVVTHRPVDAAAITTAATSLADTTSVMGSRDFDVCALMPKVDVVWPGGKDDPLAALRNR